MNVDAHNEYLKADAALNDEYKKLLAARSDDADSKKKLVEAERLWVKFRDAECESEADDHRGGTPGRRCGCGS